MIYEPTVALVCETLLLTMVSGDSRHISYPEAESGSMSETLDKWWTYDGLSGPKYWSLSEWKMCGIGKQQSPINISPKYLLHDPNLSSLTVNITNVHGLLFNTGNDVTLYLSNDESSHINITGGPLAYVYTITDLKFHFGKGRFTRSEHSINDKYFPAEVPFWSVVNKKWIKWKIGENSKLSLFLLILGRFLEGRFLSNDRQVPRGNCFVFQIQIRGYNRDVYRSYNDAVTSVRGIVILAVFVEIGQERNPAYEILNEILPLIKHRGNRTSLRNFPIHFLMSNTDEYMTYEGSLTQPGCQESVTWIILNTPVFVTEEQLKVFQNEASMEWHKNNARPLQSLNHRVLRTNIHHRSKKSSSNCPIEKKIQYEVNAMYKS